MIPINRTIIQKNTLAIGPSNAAQNWVAVNTDWPAQIETPVARYKASPHTAASVGVHCVKFWIASHESTMSATALTNIKPANTSKKTPISFGKCTSRPPKRNKINRLKKPPYVVIHTILEYLKVSSKELVVHFDLPWARGLVV